MLVEQAVFTSTNSSLFRGYQLAGRSPGVDDQLAQALCRWSPGHDALFENVPGAESLNFYQPCHDWFVLSRSFCGGPEYSRRGGLQIITRIIALRPQQLDCFDYNCLTMFNIAASEGRFVLESSFPKQLAQIEFPDRPLPNLEHGELTDIHKRLLRAIANKFPTAVVGQQNPARFLVPLLQSLDRPGRQSLSFTTGLKPTRQRSFLVHFLPSIDWRMKHRLAELGIGVLSAAA